MREMFLVLRNGGSWTLLTFLVLCIVLFARWIGKWLIPRVLDVINNQRTEFFEEIHRSRVDFTEALKAQRSDYLNALEDLRGRDIERHQVVMQRHEAITGEIRALTTAVTVLTSHVSSLNTKH